MTTFVSVFQNSIFETEKAPSSSEALSEDRIRNPQVPTRHNHAPFTSPLSLSSTREKNGLIQVVRYGTKYSAENKTSSEAMSASDQWQQSSDSYTEIPVFNNTFQTTTTEKSTIETRGNLEYKFMNVCLTFASISQLISRCHPLLWIWMFSHR